MAIMHQLSSPIREVIHSPLHSAQHTSVWRQGKERFLLTTSSPHTHPSLHSSLPHHTHPLPHHIHPLPHHTHPSLTTLIHSLTTPTLHPSLPHHTTPTLTTHPLYPTAYGSWAEVISGDVPHHHPITQVCLVCAIHILTVSTLAPDPLLKPFWIMLSWQWLEKSPS